MFGGNNLDRDKIASDGSLIFEKIPVFQNGECYIPLYQESAQYAVYDLNGSFVRYSNTKPEPTKKDNGYHVFIDETTQLRGVKDSNGKIVVPAKYFDIATDNNGNAAFSNGVFNVQLLEITPSRPEGAIVHYAYADLNGNDTFAPYIIERVNTSLKQYGAKPAVNTDDDTDDSSNNY